VADPEAVGGRVLRHLGLGAAAGRPLTSTLSRQATQLNEEWAARYRVWAARRP
jgi:LPS sulfotransferase NodH